MSLEKYELQCDEMYNYIADNHVRDKIREEIRDKIRDTIRDTISDKTRYIG